MVALIIGLLMMAFGVWAILPETLYGLGWGEPEVISFLMGAGPILALLIGLIAFFIGIVDIKDKMEAKKEEKSQTSEEKK
ncbi:MAG: hypothetical protein EHM28_09180 [Spirochaetaceae bacterium]|nr:MAG: hypothetical protein EHM28_09180 [Spirochaetaceae bacterium]